MRTPKTNQAGSRSQSPRCPSEEDLAALVAGDFSPAELRDLEVHLASCDACRALVASMFRSRAEAALDAEPDPPHASPPSDLPLQPVVETAYEVGREIARGGMGRIVEAWDCRHHRRVALKVLLQRGGSGPRRFLREMRVTARLQHPSIVALYEAGIWPDGEPFFAMKLVAGRSLGDVIAATPTLPARLALLPNVIAITDALAYAHRQGVVHRDLKPANVLVGSFGETVVIDWGLAKVLNDPDDEAEDGVADAAAARSQARATDTSPIETPSLTRTGTALGTPCYMAPEQARGERVDARADVYSLGALLYHMLAGEPPYAGSSERVLAAVLEGPPPPLRDRASGLAPDLLAIVDKAMSRDRATRYRDAREMAEDLKRFEAGKLVQAHTYSLRALVGRWVARRRPLVAMAGVLVAAVTLMTGVSVRRIVRERDRADESSLAAEQSREVAIRQRDAAEKLVEFIVVELRNRLQPLGRLDLLQGLGRELQAYYETTTRDERSVDAATVLRRASALEALLYVERLKLDLDAAASLCEDVERQLGRAHELDPKGVEPVRRLVSARARCAAVEMERGHLDRATRYALDATDSARTVVDLAPEDPQARLALGNAMMVLQHVRNRTGKDANTPAFFDELCATLEDAARDERTRDEASSTLGWALYNRAVASDDPSEKERLLARSEEVRAALVAREPNNARYKGELAWSRARLGDVLVARGRTTEGIEKLQAAIELDEEVARLDPTNAVAQRDLGVAHIKLCRGEVSAGNVRAAVRACERARAILEPLATRTSSLEDRDALATYYEVYATVPETRLPSHAADAYARACTLREQIAAAEPQDRVRQGDLRRCLDRLAETRRP
jgi:serine/threonine protein kinase/tetratricopeptide (TPR) repeat protein